MEELTRYLGAETENLTLGFQRASASSMPPEVDTPPPP